MSNKLQNSVQVLCKPYLLLVAILEHCRHVVEVAAAEVRVEAEVLHVIYQLLEGRLLLLAERRHEVQWAENQLLCVLRADAADEGCERVCEPAGAFPCRSREVLHVEPRVLPHELHALHRPRIGQRCRGR